MDNSNLGTAVGNYTDSRTSTLQAVCNCTWRWLVVELFENVSTRWRVAPIFYRFCFVRIYSSQIRTCATLSNVHRIVDLVDVRVRGFAIQGASQYQSVRRLPAADPIYLPHSSTYRGAPGRIGVERMVVSGGGRPN